MISTLDFLDLKGRKNVRNAYSETQETVWVSGNYGWCMY